MKWIWLGILLGILAAAPQLAAAVTAMVGTAAIWAAAQPTVIAFAAGLLAGPRVATRMRGWTA